MQNIIIEGIVAGKEPELSSTSNGKTMCRFTVCDSRYYKDKSGKGSYENTYFRCLAWGKTAEFITKRFHLHSAIGIVAQYSDKPYQKTENGYDSPNPQFTVQSIYFPAKSKEQSADDDFVPISNMDSTNTEFTVVGDIDVDDSDLPF